MKIGQFFKQKFILIAAVCSLSLFMGADSALAFSDLSKNSKGPEVLQVQKHLKALGYTIPKLDGVFDNNTYRAILAFQRSNKLKITGVVDVKTYNTLQVARRNADLKGNTGSSAGGTSKESASSSDSDYSIKTAGVKVPESQPFLQRSQVAKVISTAKKYIGVPYAFGGNTPKAFDCSGYLQYVFAENGMTIPRTADLQYKLGKSMSASKLEAGDLVFFTTYEPGASHCGIYLGDGEFIHASSSRGIRVDKLNDGYWKTKYYGGKHIVK